MSYQTLYYQPSPPTIDYGYLYDNPTSIPHGPIHVYHHYVYNNPNPNPTFYKNPFNPLSYSVSRPFVQPTVSFIG